MDEATRSELIRHVAAGHDIQSAAAEVGISMAEVRRAGKKFDEELSEAFRVGTSRLKSRRLTGALAQDDLRIINGIIEEREQTERETGESGISTIKITIVEAKCPCCGRRHGNDTDAAARGNGTLDLDDVEPVAESVSPVKKPYVRQYKPFIRQGGI